MLNAFRSLTKTWFGKILGVLLIIGLAGFGVTEVITTMGSNTIGSAAGTDFSTRDFQRAFETQMNRYAQQTGRVPTAEEAVAAGIPGIVLQQFASQAAVNKFGKDLGLGVSDDKLGEMLRADPTFAGTLGAFEPANFKQVLQRSGYTEAEYFELQRNAARRQQLVSGLLAGSPTPNVAADIITRFTGDKRTIEYFVLNALSLPPVAEPTDADLETFLKENQAQFRTKETRAVDVLVLTPETLATTKTIPEDQIAAEYERTKDSRTSPEKRAIKQVSLATPELEKAFTEGKAANTPVGQIVTAAGASPADLGVRAKAEVTDASLADAAFGLANTDDFAIIDGIGGNKRAIFVSEIQPPHQQTLEEARAQISEQLALAAARNEIGEKLDEVEELRAAFKPLTEIAERLGLKPQTLTLTPGGPELSSAADIPEDGRGQVASAVFRAEQGALTPAVSLGSNRNVWFDLKSVEPARDQTLDEVRDAVAEAWTAKKTSEAITTEVAVTLDKLRAGTPFADAAAALNQFPVLSQPLGRNGDGTPVIDQAVGEAIFAGGPNHFGAAINGDGDQVVFHVVEVTPATVAEAAPSLKEFIDSSVRDSIYADFETGLRDQAGLKINQQALMNLLGLNTAAQ
jgi:peptidyl-prolyl cis-trans isomerase D